MQQPGIEKLMDWILVSMDEGATLDKIKMQRSYYDKLNKEHKAALDGGDATSILGVPIEVDDSITSEYEIVYKALS